MKKHKKEDYPIVKYRIVNGNGYSVCDGRGELEEELKRMNEFYESLKERNNKDCERFKPKYVVKVTEEYLELDTIIKGYVKEE